ncbi:MAG: AmmeMemoRadiSam system protein B [Syntrophobacteraceae bacterium]
MMNETEWRRTRHLRMFVLLAGALALLANEPATATAKATTREEIREPAIAGTWYPGSPGELRQQVVSFLAGVPVAGGTAPENVVALIAPHAGYVYSGQVAAYAYKQIDGRTFDTVVIIAPSHRVPFSGVAVYDRGGFRTPLGVMEIDRELTEALEKKDKRIRFVPDAHTQEHALEIQLPFIQVLLPRARLVPLLMGDQDRATCEALADALASACAGKSVLIVASSDLSHFHSYDKAKRLDQVVLDQVTGLDPNGLLDALAQSKCEACGGGPMVTAMLTARKLGATRSKVLHYANSGDVTGDRTRVVGYMAAALVSERANGQEAKPSTAAVGVDLGLSREEKETLLTLARQTIEARCQGKPAPKPEAASPRLKEPRGAFVTLHKKGELRGCIGHIVGARPLVESVAEMAEAAAFQDPRFSSVRTEEVRELEIEISALTPMQRISDPKEVEIGRHGLYMKRGGRSGLLLPQVATEQGWDRTQFLESTCRKAGLDRDAWKDASTEIYIFSADIFREH